MRLLRLTGTSRRPPIGSPQRVPGATAAPDVRSAGTPSPVPRHLVRRLSPTRRMRRSDGSVRPMYHPYIESVDWHASTRVRGSRCCSGPPVTWSRSCLTTRTSMSLIAHMRLWEVGFQSAHGRMSPRLTTTDGRSIAADSIRRRSRRDIWTAAKTLAKLSARYCSKSTRRRLGRNGKVLHQHIFRTPS